MDGAAPPPPSPSRLSTWLTLAVLALLAGIGFGVPAVREFLGTCFDLLWRREPDIEGLARYLEGFGAWAWAVSVALMILQAIAAPIPAIWITWANALIYGPWLGALVTWVSAQIAALVCFGIARALGRPFVERLFPAATLARFDVSFERWGVLAILGTRLLPLISFDVVSYAAGLTRVRVGPYMIATGIGQIPACIVYSLAADVARDSLSLALQMTLGFVSAVFFLTALIWLRRRGRGQSQ